MATPSYKRAVPVMLTSFVFGKCPQKPNRQRTVKRLQRHYTAPAFRRGNTLNETSSVYSLSLQGPFVRV